MKSITCESNLATFLRPVFSASHMQHISDMHSKFAVRPLHVWKHGRHPVSRPLRLGEEKRRDFSTRHGWTINIHSAVTGLAILYYKFGYNHICARRDVKLQLTSYCCHSELSLLSHAGVSVIFGWYWKCRTWPLWQCKMKQIAGLETDWLMSDDVVLASQRC